MLIIDQEAAVLEEFLAPSENLLLAASAARRSRLVIDSRKSITPSNLSVNTNRCSVRR